MNIPEDFGGQRLNYGKLFVHTINILAETTYPYPAYGTNPRVGWREKQWNVDVANSDLSKAPSEWKYKS